MAEKPDAKGEGTSLCQHSGSKSGLVKDNANPSQNDIIVVLSSGSPSGVVEAGKGKKRMEDPQDANATHQAPAGDHLAAALNREQAPASDQEALRALVPQAGPVIAAGPEPAPAGHQAPANQREIPVAVQGPHQANSVHGPTSQDPHPAPSGNHLDLEPALAGEEAPASDQEALQAALPLVTVVIAADPEPAPAGDQAPANHPEVPVPVAVQAAAPQAASRPHLKKRKRDARCRVDRYLMGQGRAGPVSDDSRFIQIADKINTIQGGHHDLQGLNPPSRIRLLLPDAMGNRRATDVLLNAAADFCDDHAEQPPAA